MILNKRETGSKYESMVCEYLTDRGYRILDRNFISRYGEIDIIAANEGYICFIEVKFRKDRGSGLPEEAISTAKIRKICKTSAYFMYLHPQYSGLQIRFDVASVLSDEINYYENAFEYLN